MIPISIVIPTKNEELAIQPLLKTLVGCFSEVFVVDSLSIDRTAELSRAAGATVVDYDWDKKYPKKKQWCLDKLPLETDWVLFVDADESLPPSLIQELANLCESGSIDECDAYDITLDYMWQGKLLRHGQSVVKRALLQRTRCHFPVVDDLAAPGMGEQEGHYQPVADRVGTLQARIRHDDPDPLADWFSRHNRYSDWEAYLRSRPEVRNDVRRLRSRQGQIFERMPMKSLVILLYNLLLKQGWRDGRAGLEYAVALAFYQWQIGVKTNERIRRDDAFKLSAGRQR